MKKALSVALLLGLLSASVAGAAQDDISVPELFEREIAAMDEAFGGLRAFMAELIGEVKGNMADVDELQAGLGVLRDYTDAIAADLNKAQDKIAALEIAEGELREWGSILEAGLAELQACCAQLEALLETSTMAIGEISGKLEALKERFDAWADDYAAFKQVVLDELAVLHDGMAALEIRVQCLEDEDVGSFKKKVIDLERNMAALSIKIDNNRTKLEGFDHALASLTTDIELNAGGLLSAMTLIEDHEARLAAIEAEEDGGALDEVRQIAQTAQTVGILALVAAVGALVMGFLVGG
jgi:chromosome segregation ATPase